MTLSGQNLIGGEFLAGSGGTFQAVDPASGRTLTPAFQEATATDVDRSVAAAGTAFGPYAARPRQDRARLLRAIADEIVAIGPALIERASAETGLPPGRLEGERGRTVGQLRLFADVVAEGSWVEARIDPGDPARTPLPKPDLRRMLIPIGPVAVFAASNFPLAFSVAGGDTASALAAGCPVVCKAHPAHPGTSELVAGAIVRAIEACDMPPGLFSLVQGWGHDVGLALVRHPEIQAVGFTGSLRGGRALFDAAAARPTPIPVYAEMGSINPVFLLPRAVAERADAIAAGLSQSITLGVGQFCTNPGVVVGVEGPDLDRLVQDLTGRIAATAPACMLYERLHRDYRRATGTMAESGARWLTGADDSDERTRPALLTTTAEAFLAHRQLHEEAFGPVSLVVVARTGTDLERVATALDGQLTATVHGADDEIAAHRGLVAILERKAGRVIFNGFPTGVEVGYAMQHGGPYPASTDARSTSVGTAAIARFARPVCYQNAPAPLLPDVLQDGNPAGVWRMINGQLSRD